MICVSLATRRLLNSSRYHLTNLNPKIQLGFRSLSDTTHISDIDRKAALESFKKKYNNITLYPPAIQPTKSIPSFIKEFSHIEPNTEIQEKKEILVGRVGNRRSHGGKLLFLDLEGEGSQVQLKVTQKGYSDPIVSFEDTASIITRGDIIVAYGYVGKTKAGELSLICDSIRLLAPCLKQLPEKNKLTDPDTRFRNRHLDLLVNTDMRSVFYNRSQIIKCIRKFLDDRQFLEVETPILASSGGGATARPFITHSIGLNENLQLRISPELFLKTIVIGGLERVYELGKQFRNENIDATHNPEFTTCEFYATNLTADDLMELTEELFVEMAKPFASTNNLTIPALNKTKPDISFSRPFKRIDFVSEIENVLKCKLPDVNDPKSIPILESLFNKHNFELPPSPYSLGKLLDSLAGYVIEPQCHQPTFVINHPLSLSPLSKENPNKIGCAHRFEMFVHGFEVVNAYSELNDPEEQDKRFSEQWEQKDEGEKLLGRGADEDFCNALNYGLPPTAGWGIGIDRVCMLLTGKSTIKDVMLFPTLRSRKIET